MSARKALVAIPLVVGLMAAAPAGAQQDLRSPDARDSAPRVESPAALDLRSPDARDAGSAPVILEPAPASQPSAPVVADGFDWVSAVIGAGAVALLALGIAGTVAGRRRWHGGLPA